MLDGLVNTFAGNPLDRAGEKRNDDAWLATAAKHPDGLAVILRNGEPLLEEGGPAGARIAYVSASLAQEIGGESLFLGLWKDTPVFAADLSDGPDPTMGALAGMGAFEDLRAAALRLTPGEAAICATAKAMFEWHRRHRFCANCGAASIVVEGGWKRRCPTCEAEHFPRTDPVVIMLAVYGDRCLLGRQERWPDRMFSALAGFVEPGESLEEACARELKEEAGLTTTHVRYTSSQPWPFPASLMIGLIADVTSDEVTPDPIEVHEHHWLTRDEARAMLAGEHPLIRPISPVAIARTLVEAWLAES